MLSRESGSQTSNSRTRRKVAQEECMLKEDVSVCRDMSSFCQSDKKSRSVDTTKENVKEVEEEMPKGVRKAPPTKFPPTMRVGDESAQFKVPPQRKAATDGQICSRSMGSDAWRATPTSRVLIREEDAAIITRLRVPSRPPAQGNEVRLASMIPSTPDYVEMTKEVREAMFELFCMKLRVM